jgi:hypothetical protein
MVPQALAGAAESEVELVQGRVGQVAAGHGGAAHGKIFDQDRGDTLADHRFPGEGLVSFGRGEFKVGRLGTLNVSRRLPSGLPFSMSTLRSASCRRP